MVLRRDHLQQPPYPEDSTLPITQSSEGLRAGSRPYRWIDSLAWEIIFYLGFVSLISLSPALCTARNPEEQRSNGVYRNSLLPPCDHHRCGLHRLSLQITRDPSVLTSAWAAGPAEFNLLPLSWLNVSFLRPPRFFSSSLNWHHGMP